MAAGLPPFWVTLANYIGIAAIVAIGLVVVTGVGGMTSFGQASFVGFGAYTTAILTVQAGMSPWLTLPAALAVSAVAAFAIGAVTLRLSGHYLAVGTIAWSVSLYYTFANLDLFGRNDGISAIPPLVVRHLRLIDGRLYFTVIWIGVLLAALATANLLDSRAGRAIRSAARRRAGGGEFRRQYAAHAHAGLRLCRRAGRLRRLAVCAHAACGESRRRSASMPASSIC